MLDTISAHEILVSDEIMKNCFSPLRNSKGKHAEEGYKRKIPISSGGLFMALSTAKQFL